MTNELIKTSNIKMTSLELAELTGKRHDNIIRDIKDEVKKLGNFDTLIFEEGSYKDKNNQLRPMYTFGKKGAMQIALRYDAITRYKVIERLEELENNQSKDSYLIEDPIERAKAWIKEQERQKELENKINNDKPKVLLANAIADSKTSILIGDLAKLIKQNGVDMGAKRLFQWLRDNDYLIKRNGTDYNMPTQKAMNKELFKVKETPIKHNDGHVSISKTTKVTGKGQEYFINLFLNKHK